MPKPILAFDLDGTLVDSVGDIAVALNAGLAEHGLSALSVDLVRSFVGNGALNLVQRALAHHGRPRDEDSQLLGRFRSHYEKSLTTETRPFDGIAALLEEFKPRAHLAVATNKPGAFARPIVAALFPGVFDLVLGPEDVGTLKPDPAVLRHIEARLEGRMVAFVGDSGVDVETARAADVLDVGVLWGLRPDEARRATRTASHAAELAELLRALV